jgi:hypothetical protein
VTTHRKYRELFNGTERFSTSTRGRLERAVGRALHGYRGGNVSIQLAVRSAAQELRVEGVSDAEIVAILAAVVEDAGRACGADRASLMTGAPCWLPLRDQVVTSARQELGAPLV